MESNSNHNQSNSRSAPPKNVGIISMAVYFPKTYVSQDELERYDVVTDGKYTKGLMQEKMGFCTDLEDIHSIALTVTQQLIEKSGISGKDIGFLEVGTETIVDKSKSVKTVLMDLLKPSGNTDIEGVDATNACYGGTAALFHALDWCEKDSWDGRYAIVVAADIAIYATGAARPTGGCGAIAMLIGRNAPLVFDPIRGTHSVNVYDFYKGDLNSEYPQVDGALSLQTYISAVDNCYRNYRKKFFEKKIQPDAEDDGELLSHFDSILCHSPYCKLVQKAVARMLFNEYRSSKSLQLDENYRELEKYNSKKLEDTIHVSEENKDLERVLTTLSVELFQKKTHQSLHLANQVGNMYTGSLYSCLISYLTCKPLDQIAGKRMLFFSYGSGAMATMYSAKLVQDKDSLRGLLSCIEDVRDRLKERLRITPQEYSEHLKHRELTHSLPNRKPTGFTTSTSTSERGPIVNSAYLFPGTYYLTSVDDKYRRKYERLPIVENNNNEANCVLSKNHLAQTQTPVARPIVS